MNNEEAARIFVNAIRRFAENPGGLDNLESYLSHHFDKWLSEYANDPQNISAEMKNFSEIEV